MIARVRRGLSFANVASLLALLIAVGGGTAFGLAGHNTVTSDDIAPKNVRTGDIAPNAVTASKINNAPGSPARDAVNADKLDGQSGESYQLGDGASRGEGFQSIPSTPGSNVVNPAAALSGGRLSFTCGATPNLTYVDVNDPSSSQATDIWEPGGAHDFVPDGGSKTDLLDPADPKGTVRFHVFAKVVDEVTFSWFFDPASNPPNQCTIASSVQTNGYGAPFFPRKGADGRTAAPRPAR